MIPKATLAALFLLCALGADDPKPEEKAIRQVLEDQVTAWNKGDLEGFMKGYWESDKLTFFSGGEKTSGWKATMTRYEKKYKGEGKEMGKLAFSDLEVELIGTENALVRGRWQLETEKDKKKVGGLFTLIFKKQPESWRIVHDHTSVELP